MSDMGWSQYIRRIDEAAELEQQARERDMLPHLLKHCDFCSPHEMYRTFYKYTSCGPWVSVRVNGQWVHCQELHTLGTWGEMRKRGDILDEILFGSIVEGVDECAENVAVLLEDIRSKRSRHGNVTHRSLMAALHDAVGRVDADAHSIWMETHGCDTCLEHWRAIGAVDEGGEEPRNVWAECPQCGGSGEII